MVLTEPYLDRVTKTVTVALTKLALDGTGAPVSVIAEDMSINTLNDMANAETSIAGIKSYILHSSGRYVSNPDISKIMDADFFTEYGMEQYRNDVLSVSYFGAAGSMIICSQPIEMAGWTLVSLIPAETAFADADRVTRNSIIIAAGALVFFMTFFFFFIRTMTRPIQTVARELKEVSDGAGDLTKTLDVQSNNEIGELTRYFNLMLGKIKNMVIVIKNQSNNMFDIGSELAATMTETAVSIREIAGTIHAVQKQVMDQSASVSETESLLERIAGTIETLNSHIASQDAKVTQSYTVIREMLSGMDGVTGVIRQNAESVKDLAGVSDIGRTGMRDVAADIQEIARESAGLLEINSVMKSISSQTNLLSMNAAIEAAHAGEAGKGFAVVAGEIRKLAESSGEQSKTISVILKKIKDSIDKITASTQGVLNKFEAIDTKVQTVSGQTERILGVIAEQNGRGRQIIDVTGELAGITAAVKDGAGEMTERNREILHLSGGLKRAAEEIAGSMNEMSSSVDQINSAVSRINGISADNKNNIDILAEEVSRFKVE
jgi:methyl-accepting chemotaxis protein